MKKLFVMLALTCILAGTIQAQGRSAGPRHGIGLIGGWGTPYGFGAEYSYLFAPNMDFNLGAGLSLSGLRSGLGVRYYFQSGGSTPFFGLNYVRTSGFSELEFDVDGSVGIYDIPEDQAVFFRGGYDINVDIVHFVLAAGYGLAFDDPGAEFQRGDYNSRQQDFADLMALGGIELSLTIIFRIGK